MRKRVKLKTVKVKTVENEVKVKKLSDYKDDYTCMTGTKIVNLDKDTDLHLTIKRGGEYGLPELQVREFKCTKTFKGVTKRGIDIPLNVLEEVSDLLVRFFDDVEEKGYINEYK